MVGDGDEVERNRERRCLFLPEFGDSGMEV